MVYILELLSEERLRVMRQRAELQWKEHLELMDTLYETIDELNVELNKRKQKEDWSNENKNRLSL